MTANSTKLLESMYLFASQKISGVIQKHFLHPWVEDNARHRALVPGICPSPRPVRIGKINLDTVHSFGFIFLFGLKHKLLENGVISGDNTRKKRRKISYMIIDDGNRKPT